MNGSESSPRVRLTRRDLIRYEHDLGEKLSAFFTFSAHSLYFPKSANSRAHDGGGLRHLPDEHRLLLDLVLDGELLGVFVAKGVRLAAPKTMQRVLPAAARACLENLRLQKAAATDAATGLCTREVFLARLTRAIDTAQQCLLPASNACLDPSLAGAGGRLAVVVAEVDRARELAEELGHGAAEHVLEMIGRAIGEAVPEQVLPARLDRNAFALLIPDAAPREALETARRIGKSVSNVPRDVPGVDEPVGATVSLGCAAFPADLSGPQMTMAPLEMGRILLEKAFEAMRAAGQSEHNLAEGFGYVLARGGRVLDVLPMSRLSISLGQKTDAREGMRFLVWSRDFAAEAAFAANDGRRLLGRYPAMYKGEIVLSDVQAETSFAEVLHLQDAASHIEPGDLLTLLDEPDDAQSAAREGENSQSDPETGLLPLRGFLSALKGARAEADAFSLALVRLAEDRSRRRKGYRRHMDALIRRVAKLAASHFPEADVLAGRYSLNSAVFFLPDTPPDKAAERFTALCDEAAKRYDIAPAAGIAHHPFLTFAKPDALDNARKALDHALLLPRPMVALFDSVSLNISADRLFSRGEIQPAIEEYRLALLADEHNTLAMNSLAVCYARIGRLEQAAGLFEQVAARDDRDVNALYNHGYACMRLGELDRAEASFSRCLEIVPDHVFSCIRLGQIARRRRDLDTAEALFRRAEQCAGGKTMAARHLARVRLDKGDADGARELLHRAVTANPSDASSIALLARLYLESGQDPAIAETMARQAVNLAPANADYRGLFEAARAAREQSGG